MSDLDKEFDAATGVETTGHEWDGIRELNNPLPRWWLYIFYATIVFAIIWFILFPAWPALPGMGTNTKGVLGQSDRVDVSREIAALHTEREEEGKALINASLEEIIDNQSLLQFALASGESFFGDNCATCHGAGGQGAKGYPRLVDDIWLWGGSLDDIQFTITHGIRQDDPDSRFSMMPAFGHDQLLAPEEIRNVAHYVRTFSGLEAPSAESAFGKEIFEVQCVACHQADGTGDRMQGAANLTDDDWLYGSSFNDVYETIYNAKNSKMPAWGERLNETTIKALAVYVHSLGGGEPS